MRQIYAFQQRAKITELGKRYEVPITSARQVRSTMMQPILCSVIMDDYLPGEDHSRLDLWSNEEAIRKYPRDDNKKEYATSIADELKTE